MTILVRPCPFPAEGPGSFRLRVAEANLLSVREVDDLMIGELESNEASGIWDRWHTFKDEQSLWLHRGSRWCPNCLLKTGYGRIGWELLFADACAACGNWLADVCLACGKRVPRNRIALSQCGCGADLCQQASAQAPDAVVRLSRSLEQLVLGDANTELAEIGSLTPIQCNKLIRVIGAYGASTLQRSPQKILTADSMDVSWAITSVAAEVLADWPRRFESFLALQSNRATESEKAGRMAGVFGGFYRALYRGLQSSDFDWIRTAFENFVAERWTGSMGQRNRRLPSGIRARLAWVTFSEAVTLSQMSKRALTELIETGAIKSASRKTLSGRNFLTVLRADVEAHSNNKPQDMSLMEASTCLGIKRQRLSRLLPVICPSARKTTLAGTPWLIPSSWVNSWGWRLKDLESFNRVPSAAISLDYLFRYGPLEDDQLGTLLVDLERGKVSAIGKDPKKNGLSGLIFNRSELESRYTPTPGDPLSIPDAAKRLGVKEEVGYALARLSLLETKQLNSGRRKAMGISMGALEKFKCEYVFATELAEWKNCSCRAIASELSAQGVNPVAGPAVGNCRQLVYRRAETLLADLG